MLNINKTAIKPNCNEKTIEAAKSYRVGGQKLFKNFLIIFLINRFLLFSFFIGQVLISHQFYTHQCIHVNPNLLIHHTTTPTPRCFAPLVSIRLFSASVSQFLPCKRGRFALYHFSSFHIYALIYDICFSLSDLLHSV